MRSNHIRTSSCLPALAAAWMVVFSAVNAMASGELRFDRIAKTPYDSQIGRIHQVLEMEAKPGDNTPSMEQVNRWVRQLRCVRYEFSNQWKTPEEFRTSAAGDCKAKCVSLYYLMKAHGAKNLMLVIGRENVSQRGSHAWLIWKNGDQLYILDPTNRSAAIALHGFDADRYIPHYAFSNGGKFRPEFGG